MINVQYTGQAVVNQGVKGVIYGKAGTGKTRLAATLPQPIILSAESGLLSLRRENLPFIEIDSLQKFKETYLWLATQSDGGLYHSIVIDSLSEIAEVILRDAKAKQKDPRKAYGDVLDETVAGVRFFRDLPYRHVFVICKEEWQKDEQTGVFNFGPMFPGTKLGPQIPYFFDEVFRLVVHTDPITKQQWSGLQTQPDSQSVAKDRSGMLQPIEPPHLGNIIAKIYG